jgi:integrase
VPTVNLTARLVAALKPPPPKLQVTYWDESLPGFGVRVSYLGTKTWTVMYRHGNRVRRLKLGRVTSLDLAEARKRARGKLAAVDDGDDPAADKAAIRAGKTFGELAHEYLERHAKVLKKSWKQDERMLNQEPLPRWKNVKLADLSRADVRSLIEGIVDRGAPIHANRMLALIRKIMNFAVEREWIEHSPCDHIKPMGKEVTRDRVLSHGEIRVFWAALDDEEPPIQAVFRLRLMTGQRGAEVLQMRWRDLDLDKGWWTLPGSHVKNGRPHQVFLADDAAEILKNLKAWYERRLVEINEGRKKKRLEPKELSELVFPSPRAEKPVAWIQKAAQRIRARADIDFRPHDLRRTAATGMAAAGVSRDVVKKVLNHTERDVTATYLRYDYDAEKRKALTSWGRALKRILAPKPNKAVLFFEAKRAV